MMEKGLQKVLKKLKKWLHYGHKFYLRTKLANKRIKIN